LCLGHKLGVSYPDHLVHEKDLGGEGGCHGKGKAQNHAGRVGAHGQVEIATKFGKVFNVRNKGFGLICNALAHWNQWFNAAPKFIGDFPCFRFCHLASTRGHRAWKVHYILFTDKFLALPSNVQGLDCLTCFGGLNYADSTGQCLQLQIIQGCKLLSFAKKNWPAVIYAGLLSAAVLLVYSLGFKNELVFDDERLTDGTVFGQYGNLMKIKLRMLSYGSFDWVKTFAGENMPAQRVVNVLLHLGTCWALYKLFALLLPRIAYAEGTRAEPGFAASQQAALRVGVMVYALHPVAVYAVGYLIQRSIVMATLFGVLACWAFVRGVTQRKWLWHALALLCYVLAVLSKEHALLIAGLALPLYVFLARPNWQRAAVMFATATVLLGMAVAAVMHLLPDIFGQLFDSASRELAAQLDRQRPGALGQIFALSLLNEAALFFYYGALWLLPYGGWMSIDMHPPFPLTLTSMPHVLGAVAYLALLVGSVVAVLRRSDVWGFVGLCLLFPLVLFWTEFSTAWVQDPFVLYRSYLWAIPVPALVAVLLTGFSPGALYKTAVVLALALGTAAVERVVSMRNDQTVWTDTVQKTTLPGAPNAVGRARAFMNRGRDHLKRLELDLAIRDYSVAHNLGAVKGEALFSIGMMQHAKGKPDEALKYLQRAEAAGFSGNLLMFHRGESQYVLGMMTEAVNSYTKALAKPLDEVPTQTARANRADAAMRLNKFEDAKADFEWLLKRQPKQARHLMGLGLARLGLKDAAGALETFNLLMAEKPDALAFYGRALAQHNLGNKAAAQDDIAKAVQMEPANAVYKQVQESIKKGEKLSL
jgi:predicted negative regulator of RcsB-dependent stress response